MQQKVIIASIAVVILCGVMVGVILWRSIVPGTTTIEQQLITSTSMTISSTAFQHNQSIPAQYTCDGENTNPPLSFSGIPASAKSLALIMEDPDVPKAIREDGMWNHWVVWNIPVATTEIAGGESPQGVVGKNTSGTTAYVGPCPPDREHRYFFKIFALDTTLDLPAGSAKAELEEAMEGHILDQAELIGLYNRQ